MKDLIKKILKEDNDFDWIRDTNPASKSEISNSLDALKEFGYYVHNPEKNMLIKSIYNLGMSGDKLTDLYKALHDFAGSCYENGRERGLQEAWGDAHAEGYSEGYDEGQEDMRADIDSEAEKKYEEGYDKGYDEGWFEGGKEGYQKGYEEGSEETYYKAFEEGRAYEAGVEVEDLERIESGFDPREYDEDYDKNY